MKKTFAVMAMAAMVSMNGFAQERGNMEEMVQKQAEKMAEDFELTDSKKEQFVTDYQAMQKEMMELQQKPEGEKPGEGQSDDQSKKEKKSRKNKMTDEEAQAQLEQMLDQQQKQLDITRTYYGKMKSYLTGNQLMRVFQRQMQGGRQGQRGGQRQQQQGGFGGGSQGGFGGGPQGGFGGGDF